jgi:hypothetical protein
MKQQLSLLRTRSQHAVTSRQWMLQLGSRFSIDYTNQVSAKTASAQLPNFRYIARFQFACQFAFAYII